MGFKIPQKILKLTKYDPWEREYFIEPKSRSMVFEKNPFKKYVPVYRGQYEDKYEDFYAYGKSGVFVIEWSWDKLQNTVNGVWKSYETLLKEKCDKAGVETKDAKLVFRRLPYPDYDKQFEELMGDDYWKETYDNDD